MDIKMLEKLARIRLTEEERKEIEKDLLYFETMLDELLEADTKDIQATTMVGHAKNAYRDDIVESFNEKLFDSEITVPRIVEPNA